MSAHLTIRLDQSGRMPPGPWWRPFGPLVLLCCGQCHERMPLRHEISADGTVSPSVVCANDGCTWHVWLKLDEWTGGAVARSKP